MNVVSVVCYVFRFLIFHFSIVVCIIDWNESAVAVWNNEGKEKRSWIKRDTYDASDILQHSVKDEISKENHKSKAKEFMEVKWDCIWRF